MPRLPAPHGGQGVCGPAVRAGRGQQSSSRPEAEAATHSCVFELLEQTEEVIVLLQMKKCLPFTM